MESVSFVYMPVHVGYELGFDPSLPALICNSCSLSFELLPHRAQAGIRQLNNSIVYCHLHMWVGAQRSALAIERMWCAHKLKPQLGRKDSHFIFD